MEALEKHILLVDDDPDDRDIFRDALIEIDRSYQLTEIDDGRKLPGILRQIRKPDLIVMDLTLPVKSGKECLKEIRSDKQLDEVPVVILSAHANPESIDYCLANGASEYFLKPETFEKVKATVARICSLKAG